MTATSVLLHPPASVDLRPERSDRVESHLDRLVHQIAGFLRPAVFRRRRLLGLVTEIEALSEPLGRMSEEELRQKILLLRRNLHRDGLVSQNLVTSFALIREISWRTLGLRHYESQLMGGLAMLEGMVAEMETGEGKTLTATLTAGTVALAGIPVHVISVNDYLTSRDADTMEPLYRSLGLRVGRVVHGQTPAERSQAYHCDVTYATNKELVFDYLRDRLTLAERVDPLLLQSEYLHGIRPRSHRILMRGLHFAIVDEADSILVDEARTPLIISGTTDVREEENFLRQALDLASRLVAGDEFHVDSARRQLFLKEKGRQRVADEASRLGPPWNSMVRRESAVHQALTAMFLFHRDEQYLIRDGKVQIIDEFTGRVMADRSWEQGLHQMIEIKEGCELTRRREPLAKISYQRFFRRYLKLAGMTGTAREVAGELWAVYHLPTIRIEPHRPVIRQRLPDRVFETRRQKWLAVVERIRTLHSQGRPVLVGTRTVAASEELSRLVAEAGLPHQVLNARQDAEEARIVAKGGLPGNITIATNMAGRGTDIKLAAGLSEIGGLHVIITERHEAARIDRQLAGRCGRQGDPGSYEAILSLDDFLFEENRGGSLFPLVKKMVASTSGTGQILARWAIRKTQKRVEKYHARVRKELFRQDQARGGLLSFSGRLE
ncbi:MAG: preprotein translocase subunit SecA [Desulfuromonadaceae bacterium]|nr:preprotein translocase subunit SecA [Desulfuromonadaceae bacterium]